MIVALLLLPALLGCLVLPASADEAPPPGPPPPPAILCVPGASPPEVCPGGVPCPQCGLPSCVCPGPAPPPPHHCPFFARDILMDFYNSTGGDGWKKKEGWGSEGARATPCCEWHGVTCDANSSAVVKLRLRENDLSGTLPDGVGLLAGLNELIVYGNKELTGTIPATFTNLTHLRRLYLHYNGLSGTVPSLAGMQRLEYLHIGGHRTGGGDFTGGLEWLDELQALEEVLLWDNLFHGPFPDAMRRMSRLQRIEIGRNPLNCDFPPWLGESPPPHTPPHTHPPTLRQPSCLARATQLCTLRASHPCRTRAVCAGQALFRREFLRTQNLSSRRRAQ